MFFIDSHCHIDQLKCVLLDKNIKDILDNSYKNHVKQFLTISTSINNFYKIKNLFKKSKSIFYSCGIHPLKCETELNHFFSLDKISEKLKKLSTSENVIALGETGLDYYYSSQTKNIQKDFFRIHIQIATHLKKPLVIHARNSIHDVIQLLKEEHATKCGGVLHSFSEDYNAALKLLNMGFYISFSGMITFKNNEKICQVAKKIPLDRLLIETDSPYLTPIPYRGKENQPAYLFEIAKKIAFIKKIDLKKIAYITRKNFYTLFKCNKIM
ncbi:MAG: YchF/TatD family DNA exonuclease [Buchnera aphidicola (Pentalonia nigronervosa)]|uniref:YchF/TatD family DNA exonuclease n=1 Tax=Buchnera aphidicola (Pentalonia nigronervosa) TaxID=1309793 RepID=A0A7H1AZX8_9GAMM|nr:MAG: YchF/TatD family DNA exonuclease [Buchnera aphidicola (Pentalonia nigronervosa)]